MKIISHNECPVCGDKRWLLYELVEGELTVVDPESELNTSVDTLDFSAVVDFHLQNGVDECLKCSTVVSTFIKD